MVIRKPVPPASPLTPSSQAAINPPYPTSPTTDDAPAAQATPPNQQNAGASNSQATSSVPRVSSLARRLREDAESEGAASSDDDSDEWNTDGFEDIDDEDVKPEKK